MVQKGEKCGYEDCEEVSINFYQNYVKPNRPGVRPAGLVVTVRKSPVTCAL